MFTYLHSRARTFQEDACLYTFSPHPTRGCQKGTSELLPILAGNKEVCLSGSNGILQRGTGYSSKGICQKQIELETSTLKLTGNAYPYTSRDTYEYVCILPYYFKDFNKRVYHFTSTGVTDKL